MVSPVLRHVNERVELLLEIADDELILGWRDSEWTGIAPFLEEDVAFSSIAQNEIGHARALYELAARELGKTADELAFDRPPADYRCARLVELRLPSWEHTIARHYLYEEADAIRLEQLKASADAELAGLAAKIDREELYHRMHAQMWFDRLENEPRFVAALDELRPLVGVRDGEPERPPLRLEEVEVETALLGDLARGVLSLGAQQPLDGQQREPLVLDRVAQVLHRHAVVVELVEQRTPRLARRVVRAPGAQSFGFPVHARPEGTRTGIGSRRCGATPIGRSRCQIGRAASAQTNFDRLAQIKRRYDPANVVRSNRNVPPAGSG